MMWALVIAIYSNSVDLEPVAWFSDKAQCEQAAVEAKKLDVFGAIIRTVCIPTEVRK